MKKNMFFLIIFVVLTPIYLTQFFAGTVMAEESVNAQEFIMRLINVLGLEHMLPENPSLYDYINVLESEGIIPEGSYKSGETLTIKEMAIFMDNVLTPANKERFCLINKVKSVQHSERVMPLRVYGYAKVRSGLDNKWKVLKNGMNLREDDIICTDDRSSVIIKFGDIMRANVSSGTTGVVKDLIRPKNEDMRDYFKNHIIPFINIPNNRSATNVYNPASVSAVRD